MGYTTEFSGEIDIVPACSPEEIAAINEFGREDHDEATMPGTWCQWVIDDSTGATIEWDGGEKFYDSVQWMRYVIDTFLAPAGHTCNGRIYAQGEESDDRWLLKVVNNVVTQHDAAPLTYLGDED